MGEEPNDEMRKKLIKSHCTSANPRLPDKVQSATRSQSSKNGFACPEPEKGGHRRVGGREAGRGSRRWERDSFSFSLFVFGCLSRARAEIFSNAPLSLSFFYFPRVAARTAERSMNWSVHPFFWSVSFCPCCTRCIHHLFSFLPLFHPPPRLFSAGFPLSAYSKFSLSLSLIPSFASPENEFKTSPLSHFVSLALWIFSLVPRFFPPFFAGRLHKYAETLHMHFFAMCA